MQIVIDIPDEEYKRMKAGRSVFLTAQRGGGKTITIDLIKAVRNGIPLPKGHGRLIDADAMKTIKNIQSANFNAFELIRYWIDNQPTIIEADREEEE
jgi:hypothetical protein